MTGCFHFVVELIIVEYSKSVIRCPIRYPKPEAVIEELFLLPGIPVHY